MKITHLKTNHIDNPLGFAIEKPTFSWLIEDTHDTVQTAAQVIVSADDQFEQICFDSGRVEGRSIDSLTYRPPLTLKPRTRCFWKVRVWGESESAESDPAWFETGKLDEGWQANWITPDFADNRIHPLLFKSFDLPARAVAARAYVCGLGLYHLELNGIKVGDEYLTPDCNAYDQWLQYQTFDITDQLAVGANLVSVMLGNGWYKGRYGANGGAENFYGDRFALICELRITLDNGDEVIIVSDSSWQAQPAPVIESSIFDGETYDARMARSMSASNQVVGVKPIDLDSARLEARRSLPVCVNEEIKPVELIHTPAGETVVNMGQNMTGWLRFRTNAPAGTRIQLQFGEVLQDGNFFRDNLRTAKAEYLYIADGTEAVVEPFFTFYGFQYVKISGWVGALNLDDFTGCVVYSRMDVIGEVETSNAQVNQLFRNALWSQKDNFLDIPTDCPQRDERLGWTGDIQVFSGTACFNLDSAAFLSKFAYDLWKEQAKIGGMTPHIVPMANLNKGGATAWGDVATILPWNLYQFYGDTEILEQQFASMRAWVDYIRQIDEASGGRRLWTEGEHFGDWLALDASDPSSRKGGTPHDFIASAFYCYSARLVAQAATVLGKVEVAQTYARLSAEIKAAIQREYFTATGRLAVPTQTGYLLALNFDLVPAEQRERVQHDLIERIKQDNTHLRTGFIGTPYLCRVLSNSGANDLAYKLLLNEDFPSWLYAVNLGATTIWERWNSLNPDGSMRSLKANAPDSDSAARSAKMNSLNHYAYGSIVEWMYRDMCGLNPVSGDDSVTGFRQARIAPKPDQALQWARARYRSAAGWYESGWRIDESGRLIIEITIPFNTSARVVLPDAQIGAVCINGQHLDGGEQIGTQVELTLGTGHYQIEYPMPEKNLQP
ncbi:MAG TPA: family 78 glycoside hydrolase catalytic domain [Phototrophicaceae bacterium]|nr:family 78 glycoside hydrolase catalytic domain [Phototrophicaceae bacterium]